MPTLTNKGQHKRDEIIAIADKLMRKYGYEDVTIRMLAEEAEISRGHLGHYFKEKKDVLYALMDDMLGKYWKQSRKLFAEVDDPFLVYSFVLHWFCIVVSQRSDIRRVCIQGLKYWELQHEFSERFANLFLSLIRKSGVEAGADDETYIEAVQMAFAAHFTDLCKHENALTLECVIASACNHMKILCLLLGRAPAYAETINRAVEKKLSGYSVERLAEPFEHDYQWYEVEKNPFIL